MSTATKNSLDNLAASLGLEEINTHEAANNMAFAMLRAIYRNPEPSDKPLESFKKMSEFKDRSEYKASLKDYDLSIPAERAESLELSELLQLQERLDRIALNKKIEAVYKEWTNGAEWVQDNDKVLSTLLLGAPGQGKTTAFKQSAQKVANALGLRFLLNPDETVIISRNDFVFTTQEFSAENSKMELSGLPAKTTVQDEEVMTRLIQWRLAALKKAGAGLLLLDDFPNASPNIQNLGLSLTDEKRYQGLDLSNVYIGLTGNLGALDGTHTTKLSSALRGRCEIYYTRDTLKNFVARSRVKFNDEIADVGILGFLEKYENHFASLPNARESGGFTSPRTWEHFIVEARRAIRDAGGRQNGMKALPTIVRKARALLGPAVGNELNTYLNSLMNSADPIARQAIYEGKLDETELSRRFKNGFSSEEQHFAYQYSLALSDYAVNRISKEPTNEKVFQEVISNFGKGIIPMDQSSLGFAMDSLKNNLALRIPTLSSASGNNDRVLTMPVKSKICEYISKTPGFTEQHKETMIDAITNADKYESTNSHRSRRSK